MRNSTCWTLVLAGFLLPGVGTAQDHSSTDPNLNPSLLPAPRVETGQPSGSALAPTGSDLAWGSQQGVTWIGATQFTGRLSSSAPALSYVTAFFFESPVTSGTTERYYAQLVVEPGLLISHVRCAFRDFSAAEDLQFWWFKYTTDFDAQDTTEETLDTFATSGNPGYAYGDLTPPAPETMHVFDPTTDDLINHYLGVELGTNTSFTGCWAFWTRQVAPAPAVATFADVPTGHLFFQQIEALVGAGITSGCGDGTDFCPGAPVTRGQMAAFIATALGLGFPH